MSYLLQDDDGQILEAHSISAGLDYPGIGPEHSFLFEEGRVSYDSITDKEALDAFVWLSQKEGIIPAFESSHAVAYLKKLPNIKDKLIIVNLSGRGDKDMIQAKSLLHFE
jgi:tryptophan synthase beta chain